MRSDGFVLVTLIPRERVARVAAALTRGVRLHCLERWTELRGAHRFTPDAVMIDPLACDSPSDLNDALRGVVESSGLIVYTSVTPTAMRRLLDVPILSGASLILGGVDDSPEVLRTTIDSVAASAHRRRALEKVRACAGPLPRDVWRALTDLLMDDKRRLTVIELARAAHMCVRTLERRLHEAGAPSPVSVIKSARAVLARELLCSSSLSVQEVARRVGYAKLDSLRMLLRGSFNASPSLLRKVTR